MIPLSLLFVLASLGLLVAGLAVGGQALVWGSLAASLAAGGCLLLAVLQRRGQPPVADTGPGGPLLVPVDLGAPVVGPSVPPPEVATPAPGPPPAEVTAPAPGPPPAEVAPPTAPQPAAGQAPVPQAPVPPPPTVELGSLDESWSPQPPFGSAAAGPAESPPRQPGTAEQPPDTAARPPEIAAQPPAPAGEPAIEDIPVQDALRAAQLSDTVLVIDGRPRYHLPDCERVAEAATVPLPVSAARRAGFTPCALCRPDATLLARSRSAAKPR